MKKKLICASKYDRMFIFDSMFSALAHHVNEQSHVAVVMTLRTRHVFSRLCARINTDNMLCDYNRLNICKLDKNYSPVRKKEKQECSYDTAKHIWMW